MAAVSPIPHFTASRLRVTTALTAQKISRCSAHDHDLFAAGETTDGAAAAAAWAQIKIAARWAECGNHADIIIGIKFHNFSCQNFVYTAVPVQDQI